MHKLAVMIEALRLTGAAITPSTISTINTVIADKRRGTIKPNKLSDVDIAKLKDLINGIGQSLASELESMISGKSKIPTSVNADLSSYAKKTEVNEAVSKMQDVLNERLDVLEQRAPVEVVIRKSEKVKIKAGVQHFMFPILLEYIQMQQNVWLTGPAGSGKTRGAREVAKHLSLKYFSKSLSKMTPVSHLLGYMDANGKYIRTAFRDAIEKGGLFLLDECDSGSADVLVAFNDALACDAGDMISFPDGMVAKHKDFVAIAAANTFGEGANRVYVGRSEQDAASLDRFTFLDWPYDLALELHIAGDETWVLRVQAYRKAADELGCRVIISPRASIKGAMALKAGRPLEEVEKALIWKGASAEVVAKIKAKAVLPTAVDRMKEAIANRK